MAWPAGMTAVAAVAMLAGATAGCQLVLDFDDSGQEDLVQFAYVKASNTGAGDEFGNSVALDGDTLAVGAHLEDDNTGAVYVFRRDGSTWVQEARLESFNLETGDRFGESVALSGDTLAVGAPGEDSRATGVGGDPNDEDAESSGAVYVFRRDGATWTQEAYVKASNTDLQDFFGTSVALAGDTLAVGATGEDSGETGVNGTGADDSAGSSGAVYVFRRDGAMWAQEAYLKASNTGGLDELGSSVALSGDTLAVGAPGEASIGTGIDPAGTDDEAVNSGAVYVFVRTGETWSQQVYLKASNTDAGDAFGHSVALAGDTLAIGAPGEDSPAAGVGGDEGSDAVSDSGAVYAFARDGEVWAQEAYLKATNTGELDAFGSSVAVAGETLAVGARFEASAASGVGGDQGDDAGPGSGAVYVFERRDAAWAQAAYVKPSNTGRGDVFGHGVALSGEELAVGAPGEDSAATGIDGDEGDDSADNSGAVYSFR